MTTVTAPYQPIDPIRGSTVKTAQTSILDIAYEESGPASGRPVLLMHGFPDDVHAYDRVAPPLAAFGYRVIVPYLRGYGPTRFRSPATLRSGQQAALGHDLLDLIDALDLEKPILAGYDWGGRAACIVAALSPERVGGLVSISGYNIQNIAASGRSAPPEAEYRHWYQWYFHTERGRAGLAANRGPLCRLLWELWSPNYRFTDADYALTAASFDNPHFVDVVIQSYRHRYGNAPGDPAYDASEEKLAMQPSISVPTIVLHGAADGVGPAAGSEGHAPHFTGSYVRRVIPVAGHFLPREAPEAVVAAVEEVGGG
jgi:pimeloyl-ACP methyl ester carboxylesterase